MGLEVSEDLFHAPGCTLLYAFGQEVAAQLITSDQACEIYGRHYDVNNTHEVQPEDIGPDGEKVERSRAAIADNRVSSKVGDYEYELSRGFLFCASCGRAMTATTRRFREKGTAYYFY